MPPKSRAKTKASKTAKSIKTAATTASKTSTNTRSKAKKALNFGLSDEEESDEDLKLNMTNNTKVNGNGTSKKTKANGKTTNGRAAKRKPVEVDDDDLEEDDDGFVFTRSKPAKKTKTRKASKKAREPTPPPSPPAAQVKKTRSKKTKAVEETPFPATRLRTNEPITNMNDNDNTNNNNNTPINNTESIALPISDTPVIRRNQELRRKSGVRRSSLSNRGKRVSSIGNGFVAVPHEEVDPKDFYKHSSSDIPEPHRMKQILLWCSRRLLDTNQASTKKSTKKQSTEEVTAQKIAQVIKDELVRDLGDGKITTSWWTRPEEESDDEQPYRVKKPNANNVTNQQNLAAFQKKLDDLEKEKQAWLQKLESIKAFEAPALDSSLKEQQQKESQSVVNVYNKINEECQDLEPRIDRLYDLVHRIGAISESSKLFRSAKMEKISNQVGGQTVQDDTGQRDVLRALSRVDQ